MQVSKKINQHNIKQRLHFQKMPTSNVHFQDSNLGILGSVLVLLIHSYFATLKRNWFYWKSQKWHNFISTPSQGLHRPHSIVSVCWRATWVVRSCCMCAIRDRRVMVVMVQRKDLHHLHGAGLFLVGVVVRQHGVHVFRRTKAVIKRVVVGVGQGQLGRWS